MSERYDFDSVRVGIQPFSTDFRGFLFQDNQLGVRFFGNRDNNRWQYNLAYFRRFDKDTNSGLNDVGTQLRKDDVFVANVYRQDLPVPGFTSQLSYVRNTNHEAGEFHYDTNGFLVRPAQIGDGRGYNYDVNYLGYNGDGHFGRINLTTSAYWAIGHQDHNQFSGLPNSGADHHRRSSSPPSRRSISTGSGCGSRASSPAATAIRRAAARPGSMRSSRTRNSPAPTRATGFDRAFPSSAAAASR